MRNTNLVIDKITCTPFQDQRPGTAGLRKKVSVFTQPGYLECFVEAIFTASQFPPAATLIVGGDGRFFNEEAIQVIIQMAAAHDIGHVVIGRNGILSTPAASILIRERGAHGGFILTASHNPGGPDGDFGIKFNTATGGQAPEQLTEAVYEVSRRVSSYSIAALPTIDLSTIGVTTNDGFTVEIIDPTIDYINAMERLFDFDAIAKFFSDGARISFDALHGVTGPYARHILVDRLGAPISAIRHADPLPDFGGLHPDPNPVDAPDLFREAFSADAPDLAAASDGDGDRNMILGPGLMLSPCDSIAVMLAHASRIPGYKHGVPGVARSMPTSRALDRVAARMNIPCFETPTGWRYFCNLLEAGMIGLCGEESFGAGSAHAREKDGLWAVLFWLNLLAILKRGLPEIVADHWSQFGRHYYQRQDYFVSDGDRALSLIENLRHRIRTLDGKSIGGTVIESADDFHYLDPVDGSESTNQGIRIVFTDGARIVYRLSGTGTTGATLRVYLEKLIEDQRQLTRSPKKILAPLAAIASELGRIKHFTDLTNPTATI